MKNQTIGILFLVIMASACSKQENQTTKVDENFQSKIVAYVHGWQDNWGENNEKANQITHINYAFANIKDGKVIEGNENDGEIMKKLNGLKKTNKDLKILISVGGWSWSKNFSDAVLTENSRQIFANSAIDFMLKHEIDGVDLDWEYPGQKGDNNVFRPEDKENFTAILKLLRKKLDSVSVGKETYLLTIATAANSSYFEHTNMREAQQYLDFINIMAYDFYVGGQGVTGHHANLFRSEFDLEKGRSADLAVEDHVKAGVPIEKLVLGVPFYGRWWKGVNPINNGLFQPTQGNFGSINYKDISDSLKTNVFFSYWDSTASAPYIWREKDSLFMTYENPKSLQDKVDYVKSKNMGGIMFWQFNGDNGDLLTTISDDLFNKK
jgi:chitinase